MSTMASQISSLTIVYSTIYSGADQKKKKLHITGLCEGNSPVTGEFPTQRASNAENVSILWRHHDSIIGILRGYAIRSGRRPEGSQRPQGGPQVRPGRWLPEGRLPDRIA